VHKKQPLTEEQAELAAYLMMQTGDPSDNFHGWVRLAMWSWAYDCRKCRKVLGRLKTPETVAALYARYTTDALKALRLGIQKDAEALGWNKQRFYTLGSGRKADRSQAEYIGFRVDWWVIMEEFRDRLLPVFRESVELMEGMCTDRFKKGVLEKELDRMTIDPRWWSGGYSDAQLWSGMESCFRYHVNPYQFLIDYVSDYGALPFLENMYAVRVSSSAWPMASRFRRLTNLDSLREFYGYLLGDGPPYPCALTLQLKAASLGLDHLYFIDGGASSILSMSLVPNEFLESEASRWLDGIAGNPGVVRFLKGCLPKALVST
jgi:hypothetical protein